MGDLLDRLGSIRKLGQDASTLPSPNIEDDPRDSLEKAKPRRCEEGRSIHIRLPIKQINKLDLLRLAANSSRASLIALAVEEYLSSEKVLNELATIKKSIK